MRKVIAITLGVLIFIGIFLIALRLESLKKIPARISTTTPTPSSQALPQQERMSANYDKAATEKLLLIATTRPTPSAPSDATIREQLIQGFGGKSGTINQTDNYTLQYVVGPNDFESEIVTSDIAAAKQETIAFLRTKGLTDDGICKLPLAFFLNFEILKSQRISGKTFSPIPDFCK